MPRDQTEEPARPVPPRSRFERASSLRDRLMADSGFRRWAASTPIFRGFARRSAGALFDLCAGFVYSQTLLACVQIGLFDALRRGPRHVGELAAEAGLVPERLETLCRAAVALRLLRRDRAGRYGLGPLGAAMIDNPGVVAMIEHHRLLYEDLADPTKALRPDWHGGALARLWPYARPAAPPPQGAAAVAAYSQLMAASQHLICEQILRAYDFRRHRRLMDLGGGDGGFAAAVTAAAPELHAVVYDLPDVAARARQRIAAAASGGRCSAVGGDFFRDPLPADCDIAALVRVLHDHDDAAVATLLRRVHAALPPGGTLLIAEPLSGSSRAGRSADAYFSIYLLAMGSGRPRRGDEMRALLETAGFRRVRQVPTDLPLLAGLVIAQA
jgi:demethylspheroidene O-methyltransferase